MSGGTDIDVVLHLFDASPKTDYLIIKGGKLTQEKEKMELVIEIEVLFQDSLRKRKVDSKSWDR